MATADKTRLNGLRQRNRLIIEMNVSLTERKFVANLLKVFTVGIVYTSIRFSTVNFL